MPARPDIALGFRAPQAQVPEPASTIAQALQLRHMAQAGKAQEIQLREQERAMAEADELRRLYAQAGGDLDAMMRMGAGRLSPQTVMSLQRAAVEHRKQLASMAEQELQVAKAHTEALSSAAQSLLGMDPSKRLQHWPTVRAALVTAGHAPAEALPDQYPGDDWAQLQGNLAVAADKQLELEFRRRADARAGSQEQRAAQLFPTQLQASQAGARYDTARAAGQAPIQPAEQAAIDSQRASRASTEAYQRARLAQGASGNAMTARGQTFTREAQLRDDFRQDSKNFAVVRDAYGRIRQAATSATGPGDISLLYAYMRILDPGSTVREGEFATAANAGGVAETVRNMYNRVLRGERLTSGVRAQFVTEANRIFSQASDDHNKMKSWYRETSARSGVNPDNVLVDYSSTLSLPGVPAQGTVRMRAPTGETQDVAEADVPHYERLGARRVR